MDQANIVVTKVRPLEIPQVEIHTSDGWTIISDLSDFSGVKCFPKDQEHWNSVSITAYGFNVTWASRFEVHVDQIVDRAISKKETRLQA